MRYGKGVYFALTSNYSNNYAAPDDRGVKHMFVCRVLAGETSQGENEQLVVSLISRLVVRWVDGWMDGLMCSGC